VAKSSNGRTYYVLQAAYVGGKACGEYKSPSGTTTQPGGSTGVSQLIVPVNIATPDEDGRVFHIVKAGQSFWAIAVAYKITIRDLETWNNLSRDSKLQIGQRLFIPGSNTEGYSTPTPVGMVKASAPDVAGKINHEVQPYQTLTTIAQAYGVTIETILNLNGLQVDWPLQIGQRLLIDPGSATPSPSQRPLSPIEKLTPDSDGYYYHTVKPGETLLWIANLYEVGLNELLNWNGLTVSSLIHPDQRLFLRITLPASATPTHLPTTLTPTPSPTPPIPTPRLSQTQALPLPTNAGVSTPVDPSTTVIRFVFIALALGGLLLMVGLLKRK
jgi:LysM repeat protein